MPNKSRRILGIDPGYGRLGYGVLEEKDRTLHCESYGCIETPAKEEAPVRLAKIAQELRSILQRYQPDLIAVEKLFFAKNTKTALGVSEARGVVLLIAQEYGAEIQEFTPVEVKLALTGYGQANKDQVQQMVERLLKVEEKIASDDAADALAIAICAAHTKIPT
ncbi:MAG: crossover junction endodeoxyribonuclease RuvC [Candidatus Nomurabacteria bacterium]|nr:MAG: crossover junction endodeoxyribonuclease RuvC [Candidatus Nomurabacteria bacterium]